MAIVRDLSHAQIAFQVEGGNVDQFQVMRYRGTEGLCQLYRFEIELASSETAVPLEGIVGRAAVLSINSAYGTRWFHGIVGRFEMTGQTTEQTYFRAELVPTVWLLTHRYNSRIFQKKKVPDIVSEVLIQAGISSDRFKLDGISRSYQPREYCVQYRETDYNFICRLMEEEGIRWYFEQDQEDHILVLADGDAGSYAPIEGEAALPFHPPTGMNVETEHVFRFRLGQSVRPGATVLTDFNPENPKLDLKASGDSGRDPGLEFFDYPGKYTEQAAGQELATLRAEEFETNRISGVGQANSPRMTPGRTFELTEHPAGVNGSYLICSVTHQGKQSVARTGTGGNGEARLVEPRVMQSLEAARQNENQTIRELAEALLQIISRFRGGDKTAHRALTEWLYHAGQVSKDVPSVAEALGGNPLEALSIPNLLDDVTSGSLVDYDAPVYECRFECIPAAVTYRPPRVTPWPVMRGTQTARVVGKQGEEIDTDEYGRVKVQFHWDRAGNFDQNASCWIRVTQPMAGGNYGIMFLPRIGQEVVVDFLEGDVDQPIIVGRVYNADHMPPYPLPDEKTKSVIKTHSSKGGGGCNEIRFEDLKDKEQLFLQAQRQMDTRVKASHFHTIGGDYHVIVGKELRELTRADKHVHVEGDLLTLVEGAESRIDLSDYSQRIDGGLLLTVAGVVAHDFQGDHLKSVSGKYICAATGIRLEASQGIELKCGSSSIVLTPAAIFIDAPLVNINSGAGPGVVVTGGAEPPLAEVAEDPSEADSSEPGKDTTYGGGDAPVPGETDEDIPGHEFEVPEPKVKTTWIEFQLLDVNEKAVGGEQYILHKPDGSTVPGKTDAEGIARMADVEPGTYKIQLPERYDMEWKVIRVESPQSGGQASSGGDA